MLSSITKEGVKCIQLWKANTEYLSTFEKIHEHHYWGDILLPDHPPKGVHCILHWSWHENYQWVISQLVAAWVGKMIWAMPNKWIFCTKLKVKCPTLACNEDSIMRPLSRKYNKQYISSHNFASAASLFSLVCNLHWYSQSMDHLQSLAAWLDCDYLGREHDHNCD